MTGRKLISFLIKNKDQDHVIVTLLKEKRQYLIRTEYEHIGDKIKETNHEIERDLVSRIFYDLEAAKFDEIENINSNDEVANMKVYYNDQEYLEYSISKRILEKRDTLNDVVKCLIAYVDDSINKSIFA